MIAATPLTPSAYYMAVSGPTPAPTLISVEVGPAVPPPDERRRTLTRKERRAEAALARRAARRARRASARK